MQNLFLNIQPTSWPTKDMVSFNPFSSVNNIEEFFLIVQCTKRFSIFFNGTKVKKVIYIVQLDNRFFIVVQCTKIKKVFFILFNGTKVLG